MATTYYNDIQKLYVAYFNRPADPKGLAYWETVVEGAKGSTAAVSAAFAASAEYKAAYAGMSNADIVNTVYMNLFGRAAEDAGKAYWAGLLDAKKITIDAVVTQIAAGAQGTDLVAYNDKVLASAQFTAAVDTDAEIAGYSGDAANKVAKAFLSGITDANSLAASTTPAALNGAVASTVAAGTPFSVASALAQINAATKAETAFVQSIDVDGNPNTTTVYADIGTAQASAVTKVGNDLTDSASSSLFKAGTTTQAVRDALVSAQQAINAGKLAADQSTVADDNTAISKIAGLTTAVSASTAAAAALTAAQTAQTAADADLAAKKAAFTVNNSGTSISTTAITGSSGTLVDIDANGKATLHTGVDATKYTGLTDLIASYNADASAHATVATATNTANFAQLGVNMLDVSTSASTLTYVDANGVVQDTGKTEAQVIAAITAQINLTTPNTVATGATPTVAQVQTELAVLKAGTDQVAYNNFLNLVNAEIGGASTAVNSAKATLTTDQGTLNTHTQAATTAHTNYTAEVTTFSGQNGNGTVAVSGNNLVLTVGTTTTTLATLDPTTKAATVAAGITDTTNPDVTNLIAKYNADVSAAATVASDKTTVANDQTALNTAVNAMNPLTSKLATDTAVVTADTKAISTLAKDVAALQAANANATTLAGYQAAVDTYTKALTDKGFNVIDLNTAGGTEFGTAKSDIFMVHAKSETIAAFGLQGSDSVSVGSGYTLVQGSVTGANAVKGDNAALEIFVSNDGAGNAVLQIEQHAYSGSVAATTGEIVTITLTGVDATTLHLNNGIITSGTTTV